MRVCAYWYGRIEKEMTVSMAGKNHIEFYPLIDGCGYVFLHMLISYVYIFLDFDFNGLAQN